MRIQSHPLLWAAPKHTRHSHTAAATAAAACGPQPSSAAPLLHGLPQAQTRACVRPSRARAIYILVLIALFPLPSSRFLRVPGLARRGYKNWSMNSIRRATSRRTRPGVPSASRPSQKSTAATRWSARCERSSIRSHGPTIVSLMCPFLHCAEMCRNCCRCSYKALGVAFGASFGVPLLACQFGRPPLAPCALALAPS